MASTSCKAQPSNRDKTAKANVEQAMNEWLNPIRIKVGSPVFIRIIKEDKILELWAKPDGVEAYTLIKRYPIAAMSGELGPKQKKGDRQAPEGFYEAGKDALNPNSNYHLSFNIGYPNAYDKALARTGSLIMIHGSDVSIGCFAITDPGIEEVYTMVAEALEHGQKKVPVQIYPFVPTPARIAEAGDSPFIDFWKIMQTAWDYTEKNKLPAKYSLNGTTLKVES